MKTKTTNLDISVLTKTYFFKKKQNKTVDKIEAFIFSAVLGHQKICSQGEKKRIGHIQNCNIAQHISLLSSPSFSLGVLADSSLRIKRPSVCVADLTSETLQQHILHMMNPRKVETWNQSK